RSPVRTSPASGSSVSSLALALGIDLAPGRDAHGGEQAGAAIGIARDELVDGGAVGKIHDQQTADHAGARIVEHRSGEDDRGAVFLEIGEMRVAVVGADLAVAGFVEAVEDKVHGAKPSFSRGWRPARRRTSLRPRAWLGRRLVQRPARARREIET